MLRILVNVLVIVSVTTADVLPNTILLNDGNRIPIVAYGTFGKTYEVEIIKPAVIKAIEAGYRHIDTAAVYRNEEQIGEAIVDVINRGIVKREDLWITTKLSLDVGTREGVLKSLQTSLNKLKLDYVDLYLIHFPMNLRNLQEHDYLNIWKGMEDMKKLNLARSIGISNFNSSEINRILLNSEIVPSVNEIEVNPNFVDLDLVAYCQSLNITVMSYAPFGFMAPRPYLNYTTSITFENPVLKSIAQKYGKTTSQVVLRYLIDRDTIPIPRSTNVERIELNIDILDFNLTENEIYEINELNEDAKVYDFGDESFLPVFVDYYGL
ncbi:aldo-keto reductase AKR2E4-like isoform X1 [Vanessa tameamea]|uniref:Aldo-keto reductase AKR2E4-like isoform X1 n=1 Tax=Vanessa tameamea TaxID=334116 RepID=A0A8B8IKY7_VANTA|nr:aldo-keto reductase AKR2E4-like isoform X1 [Vanessa tameamea]